MKPLPFLIWHLLALALIGAACDGIHDASAPGNLVPKTVVARAGVNKTETLNDLALPFYAMVGANYRF